jgi:hypothetical protein
MTDAAEAPPNPHVHANVTVPWSNGTRTLVWGAVLTALSVVLVLMGAQPSDDGSTGLQPAFFVGLAIGALAWPMLLLGIVAVGVRMGLNDRDHVRQSRR